MRLPSTPPHAGTMYLLAVTALTAACLPAAGQSVTKPVTAVVTGLAPGDFLNVRATPSAIGTIQGRLPNGTGVENSGCASYNGYDWCRITTLDQPKISGWAPGRYLLAAGNGEEAPATTAAPPGESVPPTPAIPGNLDARIESDGRKAPDPENRANDEKLRKAIIDRYRPIYRSALGLSADDADATPDADVDGIASDQPSENGPAAFAVPHPTPRPDDASPALASVEAAEKATGEIPCAGAFGQPMSMCQAAVTRLGSGIADVVVSLPGGGERTIRFRGGKVESSDSSDPLHLTREGSLNVIRIGKAERFEILDALALGK